MSKDSKEPQVEADDTKIIVYCEGQTPVPKYIDFYKATPFHLIAIGEYLSLKGKQLIAMMEQSAQDSGVAMPDMSDAFMKDLMGMKK